METHVRAVALLNIVFGAVGGLVAIVSLFLYGGFDVMYASMPSRVTGIVVVSLVSFHALMAPVLIPAGVLLLRYNQMARAVLTVASGLLILDFPFGSALGAYNLWVLLTPETEPLFTHRPPRRAPAPPGDPNGRPIRLRDPNPNTPRR